MTGFSRDFPISNFPLLRLNKGVGLGRFDGLSVDYYKFYSLYFDP